MRGQDRYGCSNHVMNGSCSNGRGIRRTILEERVLAGLKDRLMAPEKAADAVRAWADEINRLNRERSVAGEADRKELAEIEKKMATMISAIEDGGYVKGMIDRLREMEAGRKNSMNAWQRFPPRPRTFIRTLPTSINARWRVSLPPCAIPKNAMPRQPPSGD